MAFQGFEDTYVEVKSEACGSVRIHTLFKKGDRASPPLVLLHGYPQTHYIWHKVAPKLVEQGYTLIIPDLRGYGKSDKPKGSEDHVEYSKREMASDIVQVAKHFGYDSFYLIAHDRGGRVAHRLALDHPKAVLKLMTLDICPTLYMYETTDREFATKYWHWFFQLLPHAEAMIAGNPDAYFRQATRGYEFAPEARKSYFDAFSTSEGIHGSCEDYRAAAGIDLEHDRADLSSGNKLSVPELRVLWGTQGLIPKYGDPVSVWKEYCLPNVKVSGRGLESNHYVPEMAAEETLMEILDFVAS